MNEYEFPPDPAEQLAMQRKDLINKYDNFHLSNSLEG